MTRIESFALALTFSVSTTAFAGFAVDQKVDEKSKLELTLSWNPEEDHNFVVPQLENWSARVKIAKVGNDWTGEWQSRHLVKVHNNDQDAEAVPEWYYSFADNRYGLVANQFITQRHDPHQDSYRFQFNHSMTADQNSVKLTAEHIKEQYPAQWRFKAFKAGRMIVDIELKNDQGEVEKVRVYNRKVNAGDLRGGPMKPKNETRTPIGIGVEYIDPGSNFTSFGFIEGVPGDYELANLPQGLDFFVDFNQIAMPVLFNPDVDLHVAVDLVQWLGNETSFSPFQSLAFIDGVNEQFPGFLVSTSPIAFDPTTGWVTDAPFTGSAQVYGEVGAVLVPEPASLIATSCALLASLPLRRARRKLGDPGCN